jgi:uncharacterized protein YggE
VVPNTITVTVDATVNAAPDEATITLSVETDGADPTTALTAIRRASRRCSTG